ncbi:MAG: hypothetical protein ACI9VS_003183 [Candidatus Binatia bacterium]|jgi:hypothetical protein
MPSYLLLPNVKAMPAAADSALSTSGLVLELASKLLLRSGSGLVIRALFDPFVIISSIDFDRPKRIDCMPSPVRRVALTPIETSVIKVPIGCIIDSLLEVTIYVSKIVG